MTKYNFKPMLISAIIFCMISSVNVKAQTLKDAITFTKNEQYDEADALFQKLILAEPGNSKIYFYYGENTLLNFFADTISNSLPVAAKEAGDLFNKGVTANAADPLNYVGLAKVAFYLEQNSRAEEMRVKAKGLLPPYKKAAKIVNPKDYAFTLAKIAESYILFEKVDTSKAMPLIREALSIDPKNSEVYIIAGDIYLLINNGSNAIRNYNFAQDNNPESPTANMKIGNIYARGRNLMAAIPYFEQAISLRDTYAPAYRELGQLYSMAGRFNDAKKYFEKYLELTKGNIPAKIRYVNALFYAKEYKEVIKNVEEIFTIDQSRTYLNRIAGYSAYEQGVYEQSVNFLEKLFSLLPADRLIKKDYIYYARALVKKNQNYPKMVINTDNDIANLAKLQEKYPTLKAPESVKLKAEIDALSVKVNAAKDQITAAENELNKAFDNYEKAITFSGEDNSLINEKANYLNVNRRYKRAADTWSRLLEKGRNGESDYIQIGRAYYMAKDFDNAEKIFSQMIAKYPSNLQGYLWDANVASAKDPDSELGLAKPKFEKLLETASRDSVKNVQEMFDAMRYLGYNALQNKKFDEAEGYYNRMLNLAPDNKDFKIKAYQSMSSLYMQTNEQSKAIDANNKILALDPANENAKSTLQYISAVQKNALPKANANEITGVITDAATGQPIASASVRVKDTAAEAWTNAKGEYKFVMPEASQTLVISAKGFRTQLITVSKKRVYSVALSK
jgi:tetratricopeptide (TPR) repeat protein